MNRSSYRRDLDKLVARYGARVVQAGRHLLILHPDGWRCTAPSTPSDWRSLKNTERSIRKALREHLTRTKEIVS